MQIQRSTTAAFMLAALVAAGLSGCNTIHGIGKDTERAGEKIQKESDRHHRDHRNGPASDARPPAS